MTDTTSPGLQSRDDCDCHGCLVHNQIAHEEAMSRAFAETAARLAEIVNEYPHLWNWGDGHGGWAMQVIRHAFEAYGIYTPHEAHWTPRSEVKRIADRDGWGCAYCGVTLKGSPDIPHPNVDHVVPKSKGGSNKLDNKVLSCQTCNSSKGARTPDEWRAAQQAKAVKS